MKKVSREGIVLIKSFEGFRPRAVARPEGGWIIGYGHTLSAREGATVSEADADLLLRYDLLAVEKRLNETAPHSLNQHQFDALASFAFSVGLDRFETSDVLSRLTSGEGDAAAEAMLAWPETRSPSAGVRRRAAERALFTADPTQPVALAALLAAPLADAVEAPPPANIVPEASSGTSFVPEPVQPHPEPEAAEPEVAAVAETAPQIGTEPAPVVAQFAAVAALLGETDTPVGPAAAPIVPTFETPVAALIEPEPSNDAVPEPAAPHAHTSGETAASAVPANDVQPETETKVPTAADPSADVVGPAPEIAAFSGGEIGEGPVSTLALNAQRYAPYGAPIIGPLPFGTPADETPDADVEVEPLIIARPTEGLVLTSPEDAPEPIVMRPAWTAEERAEVESAPAGETLFGEDLSLTQGGQPLGKADFEPEAPQRFDWSEAGAFIVMGAVGLTAFGASMAAFRLASEQGGGDETSIIGWVLAVIGVACVGVSSFNLYRKFGLAGSDR